MEYSAAVNYRALTPLFPSRLISKPILIHIPHHLAATNRLRRFPLVVGRKEKD